MSRLVIASVSHRTAPVEVRERFALGPEERLAVAQHVLASDSVGEAMVLSTCNRTEIYAAARTASDGEIAGEDLIDALLTVRPVSNGADTHKLFRILEGHGAVLHALSVPSGIDSMILGETQIVGQVRRAYIEAVRARQIGPVFRRLFPASFRVAKKAHSQTKISSGAASVGSIAVELASKVFDDLQRSTVLLLGAGETGETIAKTLSERRVARLMIAGRRPERALALAERLGAHALSQEEAFQRLGEADIVLTAAAPRDGNYILAADHIKAAVQGRPVRQRLVIDVGVPRNVDPAVADLADLFLYDVDDLQVLEQSVHKRRYKEVPKVQKFVAHEAHLFLDWWQAARHLDPLLRSLHGRFEEIRGRELDRTLRKLPKEYRRTVEVFSRSLVDKLLQAPTIKLRKEDDRLVELAQLVRELFNLPDEEGEDDQ